MAVLVKCDPFDEAREAVTLSEWTYEDATAFVGDEAFIWTSEKNGGRGLAMRGLVKSVAFDGPNTKLTIDLIDRSPTRALTLLDLKPLRDDWTAEFHHLPRKLYRNSLNKVVDLSPEEADLLRRYFDSVAADIAELAADKKRSATTRRALIDARLGQGDFRNRLRVVWEDRCAVTGCAVKEILRASHIKPWRDSTDNERLDANNGLLLVAQVDALFDAGLISFDDEGILLISPRLPAAEHRHLPMERRLLARPNAAQRAFLEYHRKLLGPHSST